MNHRLGLYTVVILSAWLGVMLWQLSQWHTQETDMAWTAQLAVQNITHMVLWTAAWIGFNQMYAHRTQWQTHMAIVGTACWIDEAVLSIAMPWLFYAMGWPWPALAMKMVWLALVCITAGIQLHVVTGGLDLERIGLWLSASMLAFVLYFVHGWANENDSEAVKKLPYQPNIYPAYWIQTPRLGIEEGLQDMWERLEVPQAFMAKP